MQAEREWSRGEVFNLFYALFEHVQHPPRLFPVLALPRLPGRSTVEARSILTRFNMWLSCQEVCPLLHRGSRLPGAGIA